MKRKLIGFNSRTCHKSDLRSQLNDVTSLNFLSNLVPFCCFLSLLSCKCKCILCYINLPIILLCVVHILSWEVCFSLCYVLSSKLWHTNTYTHKQSLVCQELFVLILWLLSTGRHIRGLLLYDCKLNKGNKGHPGKLFTSK